MDCAEWNRAQLLKDLVQTNRSPEPDPAFARTEPENPNRPCSPLPHPVRNG